MYFKSESRPAVDRTNCFDRIWSEWGSWSDCSSDGFESRSAQCVSNNPDVCLGELSERRVRNIFDQSYSLERSIFKFYELFV